ncbi:HPr family phosphocarrier protein [Actinomycetospora lutea]|uniref:HPr family phosphocarrier protein n=1 Tax=Actinomycetospora lutea TaxID=663604 RepID=UPI002367081C|nr:HPr family phosphocarrier protein [Actinomycetospora lutea]MDD7938579.1 HPr family phosphocarrier protein [Actinomycetospora lutea]
MSAPHATPSAQETVMITRQVVVATPIGLHARPAMVFCKAAAAQPAKVTIGTAEGSTADARSMLSVLGLGVRGGQEITLSADTGDQDARASVDALAELLATDLDA